MQTREVAIENLIEWIDNPFKRSTISDSDLAESIEKVGIKQPLAVVQRKNKYLVVDGNRRLRIALRLGIKKLFVNVYDDEDPVNLAIILNTTGRGWDQQTIGQLVAMHPDSINTIPRRFSNQIKSCMAVMKEKYPEFIQNYSVSCYQEAIRAASYVGRRDDDKFLTKAAFWVGKHRMSRLIRNSIEYRITSPSEIEKAIVTDKPLKVMSA
jgi:hypothetical protein